MAWKTLDEVELGGKVVLTRVDLNVPVEDGAVTDVTRITRIVPTVRDILAAGGKPELRARYVVARCAKRLGGGGWCAGSIR